MLLKFVSWNVNGFRALLKKPEWDWLNNSDAAIIGIQETKATPEQLPPEIVNRPGWHAYWDSSSVKKGYSGVAAFSRIAPLGITAQLPDPRYQGEGRLLHLEFERFHFFTGYFPNGGEAELDENGAPTGKFRRVPYKLGFLNAFLELIIEVQKTKPVIVCGDFNIAHKPEDLSNPEKNGNVSGFLPEERNWLDRFLDVGLIDTFRFMHGPVKEKYTWWSYQGYARKKNRGWRLDYFFASESLAANIRNAVIYDQIKGSDHCPVGLELELPD